MPSKREIGREKALVTWFFFVCNLIAIVAEAHPERVCDMLAYMRLVVREASKFGGTGWLTYDSVFRHNHEGLGTPWNYLDASLHQEYIAGQREKVVVPCKHCHEIDHVAADCAVASVSVLDPRGSGLLPTTDLYLQRTVVSLHFFLFYWFKSCYKPVKAPFTLVYYGYY